MRYRKDGSASRNDFYDLFYTSFTTRYHLRRTMVFF